MKQAIEYSNNYVGIVDKPMRQAITQFANKNWKKAIQLFHTNNSSAEANLLASFGLLYCAAQLEDDKAENYANQLLDFTNFEFWPYLSEHNFPRYARRFALHFLAYLENEKENFEEAISLINEGLSIDSPIDDLDDIPLLETKINIFLKSQETLMAYATIQKLKALDIENKTFKEITQSDTFMKYLEENNLDNYRTGGENETAEEALARFNKFLDIHFEEDKNEIKSYKPHFFQKITSKDISQAQDRLGISFPPSYTKFLLKHGLFKFGIWSDHEGCLLKLEEAQTLQYELKGQWSEGYEDMLGYDEEQLEQSKHLITFSFGDESLQACWYYCFDLRSVNKDTGEMAVYSFSQDEWQFNALPVCEGNGFDKHISKLVDEKIDEL